MIKEEIEFISHEKESHKSQDTGGHKPSILVRFLTKISGREISETLAKNFVLFVAFAFLLVLISYVIFTGNNYKPAAGNADDKGLYGNQVIPD